MDFQKIAEFPSRLEAETVGHALDQYDIPFLVKSEDIGFFGPTAAGSNVWGASLWVPGDKVEDVKRLLTCVAGEDEGKGQT
jgi:hypothetical protein